MTRERFLAALYASQLLRGDALIVLCGEDGEARANLVPPLMQAGAAPNVVLSGQRHEPPAILGASHLYPHLLGKGVAPSAIILDESSTNTREQAVNVVAMAREKDWRRLLLCCSAYHAPRAFLTFVQAVTEAGLERSIRLVHVPALAVPWFQCPPGLTQTRSELLTLELAKIGEYQSLGHVASYEDGLAYLQLWESRP